MSTTAKGMGKETGTALALLAIYLLVLLFPLHQAAGLQRQLRASGYETFLDWSVCVGGSVDADGVPSATGACPLAGVGKPLLAAPLPPAAIFERPGQAGRVAPASAGPDIGSRLPDHFGQSRAPPRRA